MSQEMPRDQPPRGITTLDLLLFTAGFAFGWVMQQSSALRGTPITSCLCQPAASIRCSAPCGSAGSGRTWSAWRF